MQGIILHIQHSKNNLIFRIFDFSSDASAISSNGLEEFLAAHFDVVKRLTEHDAILPHAKDRASKIMLDFFYIPCILPVYERVRQPTMSQRVRENH